MSVAYIDTHIAVFLHDGLTEELSSAAKLEIEASDLLISPMALLELEYLHQRKRVNIPGKQIYDTIHIDFGVTLCRIPFPQVASEALTMNWTTDPFDRLIAAQAKSNKDARLITKDREIRKHYWRAVW